MTRQKSNVQTLATGVSDKIIKKALKKTKKQGDLKLSVEAEIQEPEKTVDLRSMFRNIPEDEQQAIINFFNLHNAAIWIYNKLSTPAMEYVELSIKLSQEQIDQ